MARPREFEPEEVLQAALGVFWRRGYEDTSISDLVEATGASRYSLYDMFGDKEGLFHRCLEFYGDLAQRGFLAPMHSPEGGLAAIRGYFRDLVRLVVHDPERRGCLNVNSSVEMGRDAAAAPWIRRNHQIVHEALKVALGAALARGELRDGANVDALASFLAISAQGLLLQARTGVPAEQVEQHAEQVLLALPTV